MPAGFSNFERGPKLIRGPVTIDGPLTSGAITGNTSGTHTGPVIDGDVLVDATLTFDDAGATVLAEVPAGQVWLVRDVLVIRSAAFDDSATLDLGRTGDLDGYIDGADITTTGPVGGTHGDRGDLLYRDYAAGPPIVGASSITDTVSPGDEVTATISGTPTEGSLRILVIGSRVAL